MPVSRSVEKGAITIEKRNITDIPQSYKAGLSLSDRNSLICVAWGIPAVGAADNGAARAMELSGDALDKEGCK